MNKRRVRVNEKKSEKKKVHQAHSLHSQHKKIDSDIDDSKKHPYVDPVALTVSKKQRLLLRDQLKACAPELIST